MLERVTNPMTDLTKSSQTEAAFNAVTAPAWSLWSEAPAVVLHRPHLVRTVTVALLVGTVLFIINQFDVVMAGDATARTWVKIATTYVVPFCVANYGVLTATRHTRNGDHDTSGR